MRQILFVSMIALMLFAGCVPSLYPLYTDKDLRQNPALIGSWNNEDYTETWEFSQAGDSVSYNLIQTEKNEPRHFEASLLMLDSVFYLDTYPIEEIKNEFYKLHLAPSHVFGKIEIMGDSMTLSLFDGDWLKDMITKGKVKIAHEEVDDGILLTAKTADLQALVKKYANDPKAFANQTTLYRR